MLKSKLNKRWYAWSIAVFGLLLILSPRLYSTLRMIFSQEYYGHIPFVVIAAIGYGIWKVKERGTADLTGESTTDGGGFSFKVGFYLIGAGCLTFVAWYLNSGWFAIPALYCAAWGLLHLFLGGGVAAIVAPAMAVIVVSSPLPVGLDQSLVVTLQKLATGLASMWLDLLGIFHVVTGVAIQTPAQAYLVEDACSGVSSLFAAISLTAIYSALNGLSLARSALMLTLTILWILAANAGRVLVIVVASVRYSVDLTTGTIHEVLGVATFASGILLALSTERLIQFILPPQRDDRQRTPGWIRRKLFGWLDIRMLSLDGARPWVPVAVVLLFALFATAGYAAGRRGNQIQTAALSQTLDPDRFSAVEMPAEIAGWVLVDSEVIRRSRDDVFGMISWVWHYRRGSQQMAISIDGPYDDWHDLAICYTAIGWRVMGYENLKKRGVQSDSYAVSLHLYREPLDRADVTFVCFDRRGEIVPPVEQRGALVENIAKRLRQLFVKIDQDFYPPVYQIQVNASFGDVVSDADRSGLEDVLKAAMAQAGVGRGASDVGTVSGGS